MILDFLFPLAPVWTLASEDGSAAVSFDVFLEMEVKGENQVSYEPLEQGSFAAYNKQASPLEIRCQLAMTGNASEQQSALERLEELCNGTELLSMITPQQEYQSLNLESYNYRRTETSGACLLTVELFLIEIRQVESAVTTNASSSISASNSKNASNTSKVDTGKKQTEKPRRKSVARKIGDWSRSQ